MCARCHDLIRDLFCHTNCFGFEFWTEEMFPSGVAVVLVFGGDNKKKGRRRKHLLDLL